MGYDLAHVNSWETAGVKREAKSPLPPLIASAAQRLSPGLSVPVPGYSVTPWMQRSEGGCPEAKPLWIPVTLL